MTLFDCKDENSFGFSLFVDVRFKLCSVLLIWIKHSLLFRNTVEPPLTTTSTQWPPTATSLQWFFFFLADTVHTLNLVSTSLQRPPLYNCYLSWRTVHTFTLVYNLSTTVTSLQWPHFLLSPSRDVQLYLETILSCWKVMTVLAVFFFTTRNCRTSAEKKGKK